MMLRFCAGCLPSGVRRYKQRRWQRVPEGREEGRTFARIVSPARLPLPCRLPLPEALRVPGVETDARAAQASRR